MIILNLLSPYKKTRLIQLIKSLFAKETSEILILTISISATAFLLGWLILNSFLIDLAQSTTLVNRTYSSLNREIAQINLTLKQTSSAMENYLPLSPKLVEFIHNLPPDIKINYLEINRFNNHFIIGGIAKTRNALISYRGELTKLEWLTAPETPASQLLQKENVNFEIRASLTGWPTLKTPTPTTK